MSEKMHSQELGLVLAQQLLQVEDLHYGLWRKELDLNLANVPQAQQEYTDMILSDLPPTPAGSPVRVIDIGCGTGHILAQMVDKGYQVDGVIPAPHLANKVRERIAARPGCKSQVYENTLEDLPESVCNGQYDVALFSESYQYIPLDQSFNKLKQLLKPGGLVIICDFFATEHTGDGKQGDGSFGGGHAMKYFYEVVEREPFTLEKDIDITELVSPNLQLVNNLLMDKLGPAGQSIGRYMKDNYPKISWIAAKLARKKFERMRYKYFSGLRSKEVFERYKTYHHINLRFSNPN